MKDRCYRRDYQERHDIDWFAVYKEVPIHVASNGGFLPKQIKKTQNKRLQSLFSSEEMRRNEVRVNEVWIQRLQRMRRDDAKGAEYPDFDVDLYLQSFIDFASKGFVSIDNAFIGDKQNYVIVAYPNDRANLLDVENLLHREINMPIIYEMALLDIEINELW